MRPDECELLPVQVRPMNNMLVIYYFCFLIFSKFTEMRLPLK